MGYKVQVKYFNSFWNKKIMEKQVNLPNNPGQPKWPGLPWNPSFTPSNSSTPISYPNFPANYQGNQSETGWTCLLYTSPSPRDRQKSRMPSSA